MFLLFGLFFKDMTQVVGMMTCYAMTGAWESFSKVELLSSSLNCWCISVYRNIMFHQAKLMSKKSRGEKRKHFLCFYSLFSLPSSLTFGEINMAAKTQYWTLNKINVYCSLFYFLQWLLGAANTCKEFLRQDITHWATLFFNWHCIARKLWWILHEILH